LENAEKISRTETVTYVELYTESESRWAMINCYSDVIHKRWIGHMLDMMGY